MIKRRTTLILGAGASMAYGFPSGKTLKAMIWKNLNPSDLPPHFFEAANIDTSDELVKHALSMESTKDKYLKLVQNFRDLLSLSPDETIDYFLEHVQSDDYRNMGRLAIAYTLLCRERKRSLFEDWMHYFSFEKSHQQESFIENRYFRPDDGHWYQYLFNLMCRECPSIDCFTENNISVITFNYDRSFEYYFLNALMSKYKVEVERASEAMNQFKVVHVYGKLGELREMISDRCGDKQAEAVPYGAVTNDPSESAKYLKNAAEGITLIWDDPNENKNIQEAQKLIYRKDNVLLFFGFGYDHTNLLRIMPQKEIVMESNMKAYGTLLGLSKQRIYELRNEYILKYPNGNTQGFFGGAYMGGSSNDFLECKIFDFLYNSMNILK